MTEIPSKSVLTEADAKNLRELFRKAVLSTVHAEHANSLAEHSLESIQDAAEKEEEAGYDAIEFERALYRLTVYGPEPKPAYDILRAEGVDRVDALDALYYCAINSGRHDLSEAAPANAIQGWVLSDEELGNVRAWLEENR